jgi:hypothetical protein
MTNVNGIRALCRTLLIAACLVLAAMPARAESATWADHDLRGCN